MSPADDADAAGLRALRRWEWRNWASFPPALALAGVAWWLSYHWLERRYGLDDIAARNLPLIAIGGGGFAILKLTPLGIRLSTPPTPRLQALARARRRQRLARHRKLQIFCLVSMLFAYLPTAFFGGGWGPSGIWGTIVAVVYSFGLDGMMSSEDVAQEIHPLPERYAALRLGFGTLLVSGSCLAIVEAYRPGTAERFLPVLLLASVVVPQLRLLLGVQPPRETPAGPPDNSISPQV